MYSRLAATQHTHSTILLTLTKQERANKRSDIFKVRSYPIDQIDILLLFAGEVSSVNSQNEILDENRTNHVVDISMSVIALEKSIIAPLENLMMPRRTKMACLHLH